MSTESESIATEVCFGGFSTLPNFDPPDFAPPIFAIQSSFFIPSIFFVFVFPLQKYISTNKSIRTMMNVEYFLISSPFWISSNKPASSFSSLLNGLFCCIVHHFVIRDVKSTKCSETVGGTVLTNVPLVVVGAPVVVLHL